MNRGGGERGSIAILALWGVALIFVLLAATNLTTRSELAIAGTALAASRARLAAEAATQLGLVWLLRRHAEGVRNFDGSPEAWQDGSVRADIAIADEAGKIDINLAPLELLSGLFVTVGRPREEALLLACNILDRRGDVAPSCWEPADFGGNGRRHGRRFAAPEELAQLPGFDDALYDAVADYVTVATGASAVDPMSAPRTVLLAIPGSNEALVDSFLTTRAIMRDFAGASGALAPSAAIPFLTASPGREYTISAVAAAGERARYRADLQVRLTSLANHPYEVLGWRTPSPDRNRPAAPASRRVP